MNRPVTHAIAPGFEVNAAKALIGLFGAEIFAALKERCGDANLEPTATADGPGFAGGPRAVRGAGGQKSAGVVQPFPILERQVRQLSKVDGRPDCGTVHAFVRSTGAAAG